jgi:hypothetical protein
MRLKTILPAALTLCFLLLASCGDNAAEVPDADPVSVFVVHCEPSNANQYYYLKLIELVDLADQYSVKLTILLTSQWAQMIVTDPLKVDSLESWVSSGHEIGCHHHPYWATQTVGASWDGYTNTPYGDILPEYQPFYLGDMTDYWLPFDQFDVTIQTGCFGMAEEDEIDWISWLVYSTHGNALEHVVSQPTLMDYAGNQPHEIGHGHLQSLTTGVLETTYVQTGNDYIVGVVTHVYNFDEEPEPVEDWFQFLHGRDSQGTHRKTVSDAISGFSSG